MPAPDARVLIELRWMLMLNEEYRSGLYGPSIVRPGPVAVAEECVRHGYATRHDSGYENQRGYWITAEGREYLADSAAPDERDE